MTNPLLGGVTAANVYFCARAGAFSCWRGGFAFLFCTFFHMPIFSSQALACFFYLSYGIPLEACVHDLRPLMGISCQKKYQKNQGTAKAFAARVTGILWDGNTNTFTGGGTASGLLFRLFFRATVLWLAVLLVFNLFIFIWPENAIPLAGLLTLWLCRGLRRTFACMHDFPSPDYGLPTPVYLANAVAVPGASDDARA
jgi:hypothetical protein